jgi:hypothetical protein
MRKHTHENEPLRSAWQASDSHTRLESLTRQPV